VNGPRVLLVEDDAVLRELLRHHLEVAGFEVSEADRAATAWTRLGGVDLVVLDWMLPDESGLALLRRMRQRLGQALPVLMLTAKGREADRVEGLEAGADDYLAKPFGAPELIARLRALLRRATPGKRLVVGDLSIDLDQGRASLGGAALGLTRREFELLAFLAAHPGRVFSRQVLLDQVWGEEFVGTERTVDQHVAQLRAELGSGLIETVRGRGYRLAAGRSLEG